MKEEGEKKKKKNSREGATAPRGGGGVRLGGGRGAGARGERRAGGMAAARVEVLAPGSRGDFLPALGLAIGLRARGAEVRLGCHEGFVAEARAAGVLARALSGADPVAARGAPGASGRAAEDQWLRTLREYRDGLEWAGPNGLVVFNFFSSPIVHLLEGDRSGVRAVALLQQPIIPSPLAPHFLFADPKMRRTLEAMVAATRRNVVGGHAPAGEAGLNLASYPTAEAILWYPFQRVLRGWRTELGLPEAPGGGHFQLLREQLRVPIVYTFSKELLPPGGSTPRGQGSGTPPIWHCGSCEPPQDPSWSPTPELGAFLAHAEDGGWRQSVAYLGLGSSALALKRPENALEVLRGLVKQGMRVLVCERLLEACRRTCPGPLPGRLGEVLAVGNIPHVWLFRRLDLVVHHGGGGTFAAACAAGVPQVMAPVEFDQSFWAARGRALGVAPAPLDVAAEGPLPAQAVSTVLGEALAPWRLDRARKLAGRMRREPESSAWTAADRVLAVLAGAGELSP